MWYFVHAKCKTSTKRHFLFKDESIFSFLEALSIQYDITMGSKMKIVISNILHIPFSPRTLALKFPGLPVWPIWPVCPSSEADKNTFRSRTRIESKLVFSVSFVRWKGLEFLFSIPRLFASEFGTSLWRLNTCKKTTNSTLL